MKPNNNIIDLTTLVAWYKQNCNGDWEHTYGVTLQTLDNPGWWLKVDLTGTELDGATMAVVSEGCGSQAKPIKPRWIHCEVSDNRFSAAGDPDQLARLFTEFDRFRCTAIKR